MPKVTVVGAGNVGATCAFALASGGVADVVLTDIVEGLPQGKALDMNAAMPVLGSPRRVTGSNDLADAEGSEVVVVTAGFPRKPGMDRMDLLAKNARVVGDVAAAVAAAAPQAALINVTNPLDVICYVAMERSGLSPERVVGMAGVLDSARFSAFLAEEIGCPPDQVSAMVMGGHGDSMVPLVSAATAGGVPVTDLLDDDAVESAVERTRHAGAEVGRLLKTASAYYSPGTSAALMARAILRDEKRLLPASAYLTGQYGQSGIFMGVPVVLGSLGVERIVAIELSEAESAALASSAVTIAEGVKALESL